MTVQSRVMRLKPTRLKTWQFWTGRLWTGTAFWLAMVGVTLVGPLVGPMGALELQVLGNRVAVTDGSGQGVAIVGVRREIANYMNKIVHHEQVVTGDLVVDSDISDRSIWVAADLGTGAWTIHSPADLAQLKGYASELSGNALKSLDTLEVPGEQLDIIVIRKASQGARVWYGSVNDGWDGDESDGWLVAKNDKLRRLDQGNGNLGRFKEGDVVIGFDSGTLEYFAVEVGVSEQGGAS